MNGYETEQAAIRAGTLALRTAVAIMRDRDEASDVAHDVVVDVLRSLDKLRDPGAFDAWVHDSACSRTPRCGDEAQTEHHPRRRVPDERGRARPLKPSPRGRAGAGSSSTSPGPCAWDR